ncbi:hypothetical protein [Coleofasciculus sp. FACHB-1120]|nr:hypothetical protein [Coleofasciculus sp. FACHB-1120]MBD2742996.1 hypothetical protein [Coleofasciculus sp. FACHB-1120]
MRESCSTLWNRTIGVACCAVLERSRFTPLCDRIYQRLQEKIRSFEQ